MDRIKVKCPYCGNKIDIDPKIIAFKCSKCGKRIDLDDEPVHDADIPNNIKEVINTYADVKKEKIRNGAVWTPDHIITLIAIAIPIIVMIVLWNIR